MNRYKNLLIIALFICAMLWFLAPNFVRNIVNIDNITFYLSRDSVKKSVAYLKLGLPNRYVEVFEKPDSLDYWMMVEDSIANVILTSENPTHKLNNLYLDERIKSQKMKKMAWVNRVFKDIKVIKLPLNQIVGETILKAHADSMYTIWRTSRFGKDVDFNLYLESILPLNNRVSPTLNRSDILSKTFYKTLQRFGGDTMNRAQIIDFFRRYTRYIDKQPIVSDTKLPYMGFYTLVYANGFTCVEESEIEVEILRGLGISVQRIYTNQWANRTEKHTWVLVNSGANSSLYTAFYEPLGIAKNKQRNNTDDAPKIFRETWKAPNDASLSDLNSLHPNVARLYSTDITNTYNETIDLNVPADLSHQKRIYLSIFTPGGFEPIAVSSKKSIFRNQFAFKNIAKGFTYFPCELSENGVVPCGNPIYIAKNGVVNTIKSDNEKITLRLLRKYQEPPFAVNLAMANSGTRILGSMYKNYIDTFLIATIDSITPAYLQQIAIKKEQNAQYIKIVPPSGFELNIAEIMFLTNKTKENDSNIPLPLPHLSEGDSIKNKDNYRFVKYDFRDPEPLGIRKLKTADANLTTIYRGAALDYKFAKPAVVKEIRFCGITPNNTKQYHTNWRTIRAFCLR